MFMSTTIWGIEMKDYASMSDFEINRAVGDIIFGGLWRCRPGTSGNESDSWYYGNADTTFNPLSPLPDYCNNPADAYPIIVQSGISLIKCTVGSGCWSAEIITDIDEADDNLFQCQSSFDYQDANPLRAAMIVFLMMKEGE